MTARRARRGALVLAALVLLAGCATLPSVPLTNVAEWGPNWQWGKITLTGRQARFALSHLTSGTLQYFDGPGGRVITMNPDFGGWYVYVTPLT